MPLVDLDAIPQVPLDFINADHREEGRLLNELADALDAFEAGHGDLAAVTARLTALRDHTAAHLTSDAARLRAWVLGDVPQWFVNHIETMDLVTARFVASRG